MQPKIVSSLTMQQDMISSVLQFFVWAPISCIGLLSPHAEHVCQVCNHHSSILATNLHRLLLVRQQSCSSHSSSWFRASIAEAGDLAGEDLQLVVAIVLVADREQILQSNSNTLFCSSSSCDHDLLAVMIHRAPTVMARMVLQALDTTHMALGIVLRSPCPREPAGACVGRCIVHGSIEQCRQHGPECLESEVQTSQTSWVLSNAHRIAEAKHGATIMNPWANGEIINTMIMNSINLSTSHMHSCI